MNNKFKNISEVNFVKNVDKNVSGSSFITIYTETIPKTKKTNNPFKTVYKRTKMTGVIGFDYKSSINRQASKEGLGEREAKQRTWGTLSDNRIWVEHKGKKYLQIKVESCSSPIYLNEQRQEIPYEQIAPFLYKKQVSSNQQDLSKPVVIRDITLDNITSVVFNKQQWHIIHPKISE